MKVIFLDVDGVLNCWPNDHVSEPEKHEMLHNDLIARYLDICKKTGAETVISSSWRHNGRGLRALKAAGITYIGTTISMMTERFKWKEANPDKTSIEFMERGKEIQFWLDEHPEVTRFCIIDDDSDMLPTQKHFKTDMLQGSLTQEIADQIVEYMNT